jgi:CRISPR type III-B/RAMP module RAMP protein Cmr6
MEPCPLSTEMARLAFETLKRWSCAEDGVREARHAALRELPVLIRRHGLRRTLHHWLAEPAQEDAQQHVAVARAFASAMAALAPGLPLLSAPAGNAEHMLQTSLALELADHWLTLSEAMLAERGTGSAAEPSWRGGEPVAASALPPVEAKERNAVFELYNTPYPGNSSPRLKVDSEATAWHFDRVCQTVVSPDGPYAAAFARWKRSCNFSGTTARTMAFVHRALIGLSEPSLWETAISIDPVYGVPTIAGSAVKGLATHFAHDHLCGEGAPMNVALCETLFGSTGCAGVVDFHDAWWVPESAPAPRAIRAGATQEAQARSRPFVREVVTPHHQAFLDRSKPDMATPFDKPVPVPQLAAHGSFLFAVSGPALWAEHALDIVQLALEMAGVGARTPEYGQARAAT